jgi:hypothetical protein
LPHASDGFLRGLLFDPEDGGDIFLRNVGLSTTCMALQHRRPYSSFLNAIMLIPTICNGFYDKISTSNLSMNENPSFGIAIYT